MTTDPARVPVHTAPDGHVCNAHCLGGNYQAPTRPPTADTLREAAALMRTRAAVAGRRNGGRPAWFDAASIRPILDRASSTSDADAEHIASWHPTVALAVADLLDVWCDHHLLNSSGSLPAEKDAVLRLARAYLGHPGSTPGGDR